MPQFQPEDRVRRIGATDPTNVWVVLSVAGDRVTIASERHPEDEQVVPVRELELTPEMTRLTRNNMPGPIREGLGESVCRVAGCRHRTATGICADCAYRVDEHHEELPISKADLKWLHDNADESHNPYWLAYCRANGNTPDEQLTHDRQRWPGGCMVGYILWNNDRQAEFRQAHPEACMGSNITDRALWGKFLQQYADQHQPANPEQS